MCSYCECGGCYVDNGFFFFNDTATTEIYTLSLHDALPIFMANEPIPLSVMERPGCFFRNGRETKRNYLAENLCCVLICLFWYDLPGFVIDRETL